MHNPTTFVFTPQELTCRQAPQSNRYQRLVRELFDRPLLNSVNFYWRLSHGPSSANDIESSTRPAHNKPEQYLCA